MSFRPWLIALSVSTLAACGSESGEFLMPAEAPSAAVPAASKLIPNRYIVMLEPSALPLIARLDGLLALVGGGQLLQSLPIINGAVLQLSAQQAERLARLPGVRHVEQDQIMSVGQTVQSSAPWGLDRSDQRGLPLDGLYAYPTQAGAGVNVYIIDTGIRPSHVDFGGRVVGGRNFVNASIFDSLPLPLPIPVDLSGLLGGSPDPNNWSDCNGHGTHVAGSAAGSQWGIAKAANLYGVRVLGCSGSGSNAGVIAGVQWVADNHVKPAVANMSLGGGNSEALDAAVRAAVERGVTMVVAAGNDNANACNGSPNRVAEAITVGSSDMQDRRSSFSNFGACVDVFAPGSNIPSAWHTGDAATNTISGTSMAAPHVAGAAALLLGANPGLSPQAVGNAIVGSATPNALSNVGNGSPNRLLYVGN
jgi:subtilisin family serine protease